MNDHRTAPRRRVLKAGTIEFTGCGGSIPCTVRNLSQAGAALEINAEIPIPRNLTLTLDRVSRECHVVWRKESRIGIAFD
jgi:hypothetical protein